MTPLVVDASVTFKWYFEEPWSDAARRLLSGGRLIVPRLFFLETSNILRKRCGRKEMLADDARVTADSLAELTLKVWPDHRLVNALQGGPVASHVLWVEELGSSWSGGRASL